MTKVDQFGSAFRSADKPVYRYEHLEVRRSLLVTDLDSPDAFALRVKSFLSVLGADVEWMVVGGGTCKRVEDLLQLIESFRPDLVCAYRNLYSEAWRWPYGLGHHLDVLTQVSGCPTLILPHPEAGRSSGQAFVNTDVVMAMTDHLAGDASLVNYSVAFTQPEGKLWLTHVEDRLGFERFMTTISKIPAIDTDVAREAIMDQLLKEPADYIRSCREALKQQELTIEIEELVTEGRRLPEYRRLIDEHEADLLVMHSKDEDQLAMHGIAYPLAVEVREIPLLLI